MGCGSLRADHEGEAVELAGWVQAVRRYGAFSFVSLRDSTGVAQLVLEGEDADADALRLESVVSVRGLVQCRPADMANAAMPTGDVEVAVSALSLLNSCAPMPLKISEEHALPAEHSMQSSSLVMKARLAFIRLPAGHGSAAAAPSAQKLPAGHGSHDVDPSAA